MTATYIQRRKSYIFRSHKSSHNFCSWIREHRPLECFCYQKTICCVDIENILIIWLFLSVLYWTERVFTKWSEKKVISSREKTSHFWWKSEHFFNVSNNAPLKVSINRPRKPQGMEKEAAQPSKKSFL